MNDKHYDGQPADDSALTGGGAFLCKIKCVIFGSNK